MEKLGTIKRLKNQYNAFKKIAYKTGSPIAQGISIAYLSVLEDTFGMTVEEKIMEMDKDYIQKKNALDFLKNSYYVEGIKEGIERLKKEYL